MVRNWLVFFGNAPKDSVARLLRPGFQHVCAVGCDAEHRVWVFYDPSAQGTRIDAMPWGEAVDRRLGEIAAASPYCLRFAPAGERRFVPPVFSCTGAIKALLGVRSSALSPYQLYRHLLVRGAEIVEVGSGVVRGAEGPAGRSGGEAGARSGTGARGDGPHFVDPAAATR